MSSRIGEFMAPNPYALPYRVRSHLAPCNFRMIALGTNHLHLR
jgi:hypothetical protein